jgi:transcriptional regulator with XRE-family HTH domain
MTSDGPALGPAAGAAVRLGEPARRRRLDRGLSQGRLAQLSGLHRNYIGAVESAERTPSIVQADRLARALGTTLSKMLAELEPRPEDGTRTTSPAIATC